MNDLTEYHEILISFLREQNDVIEELIEVTYITEEDIEEIRKFNAQSVKLFLDGLYNMDEYDDTLICPWCYENTNVCGLCRYGARHGMCDPDNDDNTYGLINKYLLIDNIVDLDEGITNMNGIKDTISRCKERYEHILISERIRIGLK